MTTDELRERFKARAAAGEALGPEIVELARRLTPDEVFALSVKAGIHNPDGTLTERFGGMVH
jgi:hypothetical protein